MTDEAGVALAAALASCYRKLWDEDTARTAASILVEALPPDVALASVEQVAARIHERCHGMTIEYGWPDKSHGPEAHLGEARRLLGVGG